MQNPNASSSCFIEYHKPCSYAIAIVEHGCPKPVFFKLERGENALDNFVALLDQLAKDVYHRKRQHVLFSGIPTISKDMATSCWICDICFDTGDMKVLDHCHYSGKFLGWAHQKCNIQRSTNNYMPIFAHNLSNYDMHHIHTEDLYKDLENNSTLRNAFDFSNIPKDNPLYDESNAKVVLKFKDEFAGSIVEEFCGLNPKLYSIIASCEYLILS